MDGKALEEKEKLTTIPDKSNEDTLLCDLVTTKIPRKKALPKGPKKNKKKTSTMVKTRPKLTRGAKKAVPNPKNKIPSTYSILATI